MNLPLSKILQEKITSICTCLTGADTAAVVNIYSKDHLDKANFAIIFPDLFSKTVLGVFATVTLFAPEYHLANEQLFKLIILNNRQSQKSEAVLSLCGTALKQHVTVVLSFTSTPHTSILRALQVM